MADVRIDSASSPVEGTSLATVRLGAALVRTGLALSVLLILFPMALAILPEAGVRIDNDLEQAAPWIVGGVALLAGVLVLAGAWMYTHRAEPAAGDSDQRPRRWVRAGVLLGLGASALGIGLELAGISTEPSTLSGTRADPGLTFQPLGIGIGAAAGLATLVIFVGLARHSQALAARAGDAPLARRAARAAVITGVLQTLVAFAGVVGINACVYAALSLQLQGIGALLALAGLMLIPLVSIATLWNVLAAMKPLLRSG